MQLIAELRNVDGPLALDLLDNGDQDVSYASIVGNTLIIGGRDGVVVRAKMELDHNRLVWRVFKGARGKEIGIAHQVEFSV